MTIQDALERAKKLGKARAAGSLAEGRHASLEDSRTSAAIAREPIHTEYEAPAHYAELERIEFNLDTCAANNILVTDQHLIGAGRASAAYRLMRSRILHRIKIGNWSCVGITSPGAGEGKTVTTLNLAINVAREKQRTVYLLDLDMRNPSVFKGVGCHPRHSLSRYFAEGIAPEQVLYQSSVENLVIAGAADPVPGASELLASTRLDDLLNYIRRRSRGALILIDLPPVVSTDEALMVAPRTDALFLVVCEGKTRRDSLARAMDLLSDFKVEGVILNRSGEELGIDYYGY